jgi:RNA polymerase sigma-70 factor (ECF subfamily)
MQVLHDETEADDVLQEVFLQVWNRAPSYSSGKGKLMSWLCTLARRRAIDRLRQHAAYRRATDRYEVSCKHLEKGEQEFHSVEREAFRDDLRSLLRHHLDALPPNQQEVIHLAFFQEKSQREISALTKIPLGTVKLGSNWESKAFPLSEARAKKSSNDGAGSPAHAFIPASDFRKGWGQAREVR